MVKRCTILLVALLACSSALATQELIGTVDGPRVIGLRSVHYLADINRDGVEEFLVGGDVNGGYVGVIDGATGGTIYEYYGWKGPPGNGLGFAVSPAGDFDGDGVADFAAGDYRFTAPGGPLFIGRYNVWSGATGEHLATASGSLADDQVGRTIAGVGDTNGDGYDDVLVGSLRSPVSLYGGPGGALIRQHHLPGTRFGVAGLGDVDGDGLADPPWASGPAG